MAVSMIFTDRHGRQHEITGPELIDSEHQAIVSRLKPHKEVLKSDLPATDSMVVAALKAVPPLLECLKQLTADATRWNKLIDDAEADLRRQMIEAISAWEDQ